MEITYGLFIFSILLNCAASIFGGFYSEKAEGNKRAPMVYSALKLLTIFIFWLIRFLFDGCAVSLEVLPYSFGFAVCFFSGVYGFICAIKTGSNVISTLILNVSSILVSFWGALFWGEKFTLLTFFGLILFVVAISLGLFSGSVEKKQTEPAWYFYVTVLFFGNAGCTIFMREQQLAFNDEYSSFLMMSSIGVCTLVSFLLLGRSPAGIKEHIKHTWYFPVVEGVCNAVLNLISLILLQSTISINMLYPVRGVASFMLVTLFSVFVFREKLRWWQWIGILLGAGAITLLSI